MKITRNEAQNLLDFLRKNNFSENLGITMARFRTFLASDAWIIATSKDCGEIFFEGTFDNWSNCFFSNPTVENIREFCVNNDLDVSFDLRTNEQ